VDGDRVLLVGEKRRQVSFDHVTKLDPAGSSINLQASVLFPER
jgi:hypothetical protein